MLYSKLLGSWKKYLWFRELKRICRTRHCIAFSGNICITALKAIYSSGNRFIACHNKHGHPCNNIYLTKIPAWHRQAHIRSTVANFELALQQKFKVINNLVDAMFKTLPKRSILLHTTQWWIQSTDISQMECRSLDSHNIGAITLW